MDCNTLEFRWKNFRGFEDTGWIQAKPITILIGANNSGKTSLIAPWLLLQQTDLAEDALIGLKTKGDLVNAGRFEDFVFGHDKRRDVSFSITFHKHQLSEGVKIQPPGKEAPGRLELEFTSGKDSIETTLKTYKIFDAYGRHLLTRRLLKSNKYSLIGLQKFAVSRPAKLKDKTFDSALKKEIADSIPMNFLFNDSPFRLTLLEQPTKKAEMSKQSQLYLSAVEYVSRAILNLLDNTIYIGPLRERPKRLYESSGEMPNNVGIRGQFAPELLHRLPYTFRRKVEAWLEKFDFDVKLKSVELSEGIFSLILSKDKSHHTTNFADTGFGLSQVLPLIVQCLDSSGDENLIVAEQPEIHLNPKLQAVLADLFCEIAKTGPRFIIETHSEHLVLRLRRLIAEGKFSADDVALYFVEKRQGQSVIREVPIKQNGHIEIDNWPKGFFGESLKDALGLAAAQSRRKRNA